MSVVTVLALIEKGLDAFGSGELSEAIAFWKKALLLDPTNAQALDYLDCAGEPVETLSKQLAPPEHRHRTHPQLNEELKALLLSGNYAAALDLLVEAKRDAPGDAALGRAIQRVKEKHVVVLVGKLGKLDQLVRGIHSSDELEESVPHSEARSVIELIDNETSLGDIVHASPLEKHVVLEILIQLRAQARIELVSPSFSLPMEIAGDRAQDVSTILYSTAPNNDYDSIFQDATLAYVNGDLEQALVLFEQCHVLRPDSERIQHNIERLRRSIQ